MNAHKNKQKLHSGAPVFLSLPRVLVALGVLAAVSYTAFVAYPLIEGPTLTVEAPVHTEEGTTILRGTTNRVSELTINGLDTPLAEDGAFAVERSFPPGYTVVVLEARDRFRRVRTERLTFITQPRVYASEESSQEDNVQENSDESEEGNTSEQ